MGGILAATNPHRIYLLPRVITEFNIMSQSGKKRPYGVAADLAGHEFSMSAANFRRIQQRAYQLTGISLSDHKQNMVYGRLARRLRILRLRNFDEYCATIGADDSPELVEFVNAITTNLTAFFRERHHFDYLKNSVIPDLFRKNARSRRLRVWSAGCSTGEEPYSIAMVLRSFAALGTWDTKVLATDLDSNVVAVGKAGLFAADRAAAVPAEYRQYLLEGDDPDMVEMRDDIRNLVTFKQLNLLHDWPMEGPFDVIFCRNVVIYFDAPTQAKLFGRYADILQPEGHLFIGHSESLHKISDRFTGLGKTIYRRSR